MDKTEPSPKPRALTLRIKHELLRVAACDPRLTRGAIGVLSVLSERTDSNTGLAWPGYGYIAEQANVTTRQAKKLTTLLDATGYLDIPERGHRGRSNRYRVAYERAKVVNYSSLVNRSSLVNPSSESSELQGTEVVNPSSPYPLFLSRLDTGIEKEGCDGKPPRMALGGPPGRAVNQGGEDGGAFADKWPAFWAVYPLRAGVAKAEAILDELQPEGADLAAILTGAARYAEYCRANPKMRMSAARWLSEKLWRDCWAVAERKGKAKPSASDPPRAPEPPPEPPVDEAEPILIDVADFAELDADGLPTEAAIDALRDEDGRLSIEMMTPEAWAAISNAWQREHLRALPYPEPSNAAERQANEVAGEIESEGNIEREDKADESEPPGVEPFAPWPRKDAETFARWLFRRTQAELGLEPTDTDRAVRADLIYRLMSGTYQSRIPTREQTAFSVPLGRVFGTSPVTDDNHRAEWQAERAEQRAQQQQQREGTNG